MLVNRYSVTEQREDISRFVVHLTRAGTSDWPKGGATAYDNLTAILEQQCIKAFRPHCLHKKDIEKIDEIYDAFKVFCFTEVPLDQIHLITQEIKGTKYQREPYGIVFRKQFLIEKGAQPAIYVNSYRANVAIRESFDEIFRISQQENFRNDAWRILPFVNIMYERHDFAWEREWRLAGDLDFPLEEVVCVILPKGKEEYLRKELLCAGISVIYPGLIYEEIVYELARQHRITTTSSKKYTSLSLHRY